MSLELENKFIPALVVVFALTIIFQEMKILVFGVVFLITLKCLLSIEIKLSWGNREARKAKKQLIRIFNGQACMLSAKKSDYAAKMAKFEDDISNLKKKVSKAILEKCEEENAPLLLVIPEHGRPYLLLGVSDAEVTPKPDEKPRRQSDGGHILNEEEIKFLKKAYPEMIGDEFVCFGSILTGNYN